MATMNVDPRELRRQLSDKDEIGKLPFTLLKEVSILASDAESDDLAQEMILRSLEHADEFGQYKPILYDLVRQRGLFPYLDSSALSLREKVAYQYHIPTKMGEGIVFHRPQATIYRILMSGRNVVLSAPTSFGKSLIVDALIASERFSNILIVVPTIALIDETRRRLMSRFRGLYKIISHISQTPGDRNVFVLTQERALQYNQFDSIDLFVIDEFYKLSPGRDNDERWPLLNQVFYRALKTRKQFYLLGPNVRAVSDSLKTYAEYEFCKETYQTVVSELHRIRFKKPTEKRDLVVELCGRLEDPTIVYCRSPASAMSVAGYLIDGGVDHGTRESAEAAAWVADAYHPDWHLTRALAKGIGVHHGRIPRALAHFQVRAFDNNDIRYLVCTSTLIEGVNTKAKNIVVYDKQVGRKNFDYFTFNNIRGRSGRMFEHFIGHVYLFHDPPQEELPFVDIPALSQSESAPDELLLQLDAIDLTAQSKDRIKQYAEQNVLTIETLRSNVGIDPQAQLDVANELLADLDAVTQHLTWQGNPTYEQLVFLCELMWNHFGGLRLGAGNIRSARQLAFLIWKLQDRPSIAELIRDAYQYHQDADKAVEQIMELLRLWAGFHFPRLLLAIDRIQKDLFMRHELSPGDYETYATRVENLFLDPALVALEEYGVPLPISRKLENQLAAEGDLDRTLEKLRALDVDSVNLTQFEKKLVRETQTSV